MPDAMPPPKNPIPPPFLPPDVDWVQDKIPEGAPDGLSEEEKKKWYQSKTIIFNVLMGVASLSAFGVKEVSVITPDVALAAAGGITALGNIVLRLFTKKPIK
jgi:hypothetical protein